MTLQQAAKFMKRTLFVREHELFTEHTLAKIGIPMQVDQRFGWGGFVYRIVEVDILRLTAFANVVGMIA